MNTHVFVCPSTGSNNTARGRQCETEWLRHRKVASTVESMSQSGRRSSLGQSWVCGAVPAGPAPPGQFIKQPTLTQSSSAQTRPVLSVKRGPAQLGQGQASPGQARPGQLMPGQAQASSGQASPGQIQASPSLAWLAKARLGPGQARPRPRPGHPRPAQASPKNESSKP